MDISFTAIGLMLCAACVAGAQAPLASDELPTSAGLLRMTFVGHGSLMFTFNGTVIHVDPSEEAGNYAGLPKADLILLTHEHPDHLDPAAIRRLRTGDTAFVLTAACAARMPGGAVMKNGDAQTVKGIRIEAVPAYNLVHRRGDGHPFHPPGQGNGYVLTFGDRRVYVAGDTENTPEMKALKNIDVAFLPMNLPYTMTPAMVADAARAFKPRVLYPYHYGDTDPALLTDLLKDTPAVEVRVRMLR